MKSTILVYGCLRVTLYLLTATDMDSHRARTPHQRAKEPKYDLHVVPEETGKGRLQDALFLL